MSISTISNFFKTTKEIDPTYYVVNPDTNWKEFNFDKLQNAEQCKIVQVACLNEARYERLHAYGYLAGAILAGGGIIIVAVALSKVAIYIIGFYLLTLQYFIPIALTSWLSTDLATALLTVYSVKEVWNKLKEKANPHWKHSEYLYQQAKTAELLILKFTAEKK